MSKDPTVSIVMATYGRREVVLHTLDRLEQCGLGRSDYEVIIVDNASPDDTAATLRGRPGVVVRELDRNLGACAKTLGIEPARGEYVVFLDDDSFPRPGALVRMLRRFESDPRLGAAGFTVHLPDGSRECSALPHVFVGCGVGFRTTALREVGGLDLSFFMAAEEYDLAFRLLRAGWKVETFADLAVDHLKSPMGRRSERVTYYDICNNLRIIARYLPQPYADIYRDDWIERYRWLARQAGHETAFGRGLMAGRHRADCDRREYRRWRLTPELLEQVFGWQAIERRMGELAGSGVRRVVLADYGKNIHAFVRGALAVGLDVPAIAADGLADDRRAYRGIPLITTQAALALRPDAIVISNTSYVHAERRRLSLKRVTACPVSSWFELPADGAQPYLPAEVRGSVRSPALA